MSLGDLLVSLYAWCDERAFEILIGAIMIPVLGTGLALGSAGSVVPIVMVGSLPASWLHLGWLFLLAR